MRLEDERTADESAWATLGLHPDSVSPTPVDHDWPRRSLGRAAVVGGIVLTVFGLLIHVTPPPHVGPAVAQAMVPEEARPFGSAPPGFESEAKRSAVHYAIDLPSGYEIRVHSTFGAIRLIGRGSPFQNETDRRRRVLDALSAVDPVSFHFDPAAFLPTDAAIGTEDAIIVLGTPPDLRAVRIDRTDWTRDRLAKDPNLWGLFR